MSIQTTLKPVLFKAVAGLHRAVSGDSASGSSEALARVRDFLFLQYAMPLGYCVHDTPIYEALRRCRPDARIAVATRGAGYETLRHNPNIDVLLRTEDPLRDTLAAGRQLRRWFRNHMCGPASVVTSSSNRRTRIALLGMMLGKPTRVGYTLARDLYNLPIDYDLGLSLIDNNLRVLEPFGCAPAHVEPRVYFSQGDRDAVASMLAQSHSLGDGRPRVVMVTQNSGGQRTGWHTDRFSQVIQHVVRCGCEIIFVGTASDREAIELLRRNPADGTLAGVSFAGKTSIPQLSALLCMSDCVISLDTGTMHIGRAAGVPMVVLGPSWQRPLEWLPLEMKNARILRGPDIDHAPPNYHLDEIQPEQVIAAFDDLIAAYPASQPEREERLLRSLSKVDHGD